VKHVVKNNIKHIVSSCLILGMILSLVLQYNSNKYIDVLSNNNEIIYKDFEISSKFDQLLLNMSLIESAQRGYVITGEDALLKNFETQIAEIHSNYEELKRYLVHHNLEHESLKLKNLLDAKIKFAETVISKYDKNNPKPALKEIESGKGQRIMESILNMTNEINTVIRERTHDLVLKRNNNVTVIRRWGLTGSIVILLIAIMSIGLLYKDIQFRDVLQSKLNEALNQAKASIQIKQQFMANMSHEIRTPMNAIIGFTNLLKKTKLDEQQEEHIDTIKAAGENLLTIINDILDFSKIEAGMMRIEKISFELTDVLDNIQHLFKDKIREKDIEFTIERNKNIPNTLVGDPIRLTQILINLIGNSVKFTSKGLIKLQINPLKIEGKNYTLQFILSDTGIGIPNDKLEAIFDDFNQGNTSTTREYGGTGLGLSIVKNLIELQKGKIHVASIESQGTTFSFTITYPIGEKTDRIKTEADNKSNQVTRNEKQEILVVEDNILNQKLAMLLLNDLGYSSEIAVNGQIALEKLSEKKYDLILMDLQMPVLDGYETIKKIREVLKIKTPVIAMTAHAFDGEKEKCIKLGMNDYITKPILEEELNRIILEHLVPLPINKDEINTTPFNIVDNPICDLTYILDVAKGNEVFLKEIFGLFLHQTPADLLLLEQYIIDENYDAMMKIAHRMKSSTRLIGLSNKTEHLLDAIEFAEDKDKNVNFLLEQLKPVKEICLEALKEIECYNKEMN
jgi:signal transduction histidine kinase/CheY-like chemotaxis protein/HPt (histidine-containing phosphotransfer) domain-containing protein